MNKVKRCYKKFEPRLWSWKLQDEKTHEEYVDMVRDRLEEKGWQHLDADEQWQQMKNVMTETTENIYGKSEGPCRNLVVE